MFKVTEFQAGIIWGASGFAVLTAVFFIFALTMPPETEDMDTGKIGNINLGCDFANFSKFVVNNRTYNISVYVKYGYNTVCLLKDLQNGTVYIFNSAE